MQINLSLQLNDVNTILEGLGRIQENAVGVANVVREQANKQFNAHLEAESAAQQAAQKEAGGNPGHPDQQA